MRFGFNSWRNGAKKVWQFTATKLKSGGRLIRTFARASGSHLNRWRKTAFAQFKAGSSFRQWLSRRRLINPKLKEMVMKFPITGGVVIVSIELVLTFVGAFFISYFESDPAARLESVWNLTIFNEDPLAFNWAQLWLVLGLVYTGLGFRFDKTVKADQIAVRTAFDRPTDIVSSGLPIIPPGIFNIIELTTKVQQREFPAEPEMIYRGELKEKENLPEGMKPPHRVTFTQSITDDEAQEILGDDEYEIEVPRNGATKTIKFLAKVPDDGISKQRVTAEVVPVVRWRIVDGISFVRNIGSIDEVNRQLEDELFSVITRVYSRISLAQAQNNIEWMNALLFIAAERRINAIANRSESWGIDLEGAFIKNLPKHHDLNDAIGNAAEADFNGRERERLAETDRIEREKKGLGDAAAEKALLAARAEGLEGIKKLAGSKGGRIAVQTDAARELAASGNMIVTDTQGGMGQLMSLVGAGSAVVKRDKTSGDDGSAEES